MRIARRLRRLRRSAALCAVLSAALVPAATGAALAMPDKLPQEQYYASFETPDLSAAIAQERYLQSYGEPESLSPPQSPVPSDDTPWLPIALSITGALVIVAASTTQLRRFRLRRHRAVGTAA
jgi:hypothetical protein